MVDSIDSKHRSWVMSRIRSRDTRPELVVRSVLHRSGLRFSLRRRDLPGKPDLVLPKHSAVVFVHGCFWHYHQDPACPISRLPKSNAEFWAGKLTATATRDERHKEALCGDGWRVFTVWECQLARNPEETLCRLVDSIRRDDGLYEVPDGLSQVIELAESRHCYLLKKKTGSARYVAE